MFTLQKKIKIVGVNYVKLLTRLCCCRQACKVTKVKLINNCIILLSQTILVNKDLEQNAFQLMIGSSLS